MVIMTSCCCCLSPRIGTMAVGVICLMVGFSASVGFCFALINIDQVKNELGSSFSSYQNLLILNLTEPRLKLVESVIGVNDFINYLNTILIICLAFYVVYTFTALFLTYGACAGMRSLLLPWMIVEVVPFAFQVAAVVILFVFGRDDPTLSKGGVYIVAGLINIVAFVFHVYWWLCPLSHYQELKKQEYTQVEPLVPPSHPMYPAVLMKY